MRFDQFHRLRPVTGMFIRSPESHGLALGAQYNHRLCVGGPQQGPPLLERDPLRLVILERRPALCHAARVGVLDHHARRSAQQAREPGRRRRVEHVVVGQRLALKRRRAARERAALGFAGDRPGSEKYHFEKRASDPGPAAFRYQGT